MTPSEWKAELKAPHGGYLFYGEEEYLKKSYLTALRKAVGVSGDPFNHLLFDGDNYSASALSDAIVTLPVLSDKKLVEVKGLPASFFKGKEGEGLFAALAQLSSCDFCVLVLLPSSEDFDAGTARRPSALFKKLTELLKPVEFARQTPARLASWVGRHFSAEQVISTPSAVEALLSVCGCDMGILASEIDKLCAYLKRNGRDRLTEADVFLVASENREIAAFDFTDALLSGNADRALLILDEKKKQKERPELLLSGIARVVCDLLTVKELSEGGLGLSAIAAKLKMHEYRAGLYWKSAAKVDVSRLRRLAERCFEADLRLKTSSLDSYLLLDCLAAETLSR